MKIACPNDPAHGEFYVDLRTVLTYKVSADGEILEAMVDPGETPAALDKPGPRLDYVCVDCGATATAKE